MRQITVDSEFSSSTATMQAMLNSRNQQGFASQSPQLVRAANPYQDIPSLYDMYLQASPGPLLPSASGWTSSRTRCRTRA